MLADQTPVLDVFFPLLKKGLLPSEEVGLLELYARRLYHTYTVFVIENFLSKDDCLEIIEQGKEHGMVLSTLHSSSAGSAQKTRDISTRSSTNSWLARDHSSVTEKVYERASLVTKIDPDLMQKFHETSASRHSIAESL